MRPTTFYKKVRDAFYAYYQKAIGEMMDGHPQYVGLFDVALINMQDDFIAAEIGKRNVRFNRETLSEYHSSEYMKALVQQIFYVLTEGDFTRMSGYDVVNNSFAPGAELKARALSPAAEQTLTQAGLFYCALNGGSYGRGRRRW